MSALRKILRRLGDAFDGARAMWAGCEKVDGIDVCGRREFRRAVAWALLSIRDSRLSSWDALSKHVDSILEGRRTFPIVTGHSAFMVIDRRRLAQSLEYLAADIVAMACSFGLYRAYEATHPGCRVPAEITHGAAALESRDEAYRECLAVLGNAVRSGSCH
jgi:hypothetical protein